MTTTNQQLAYEAAHVRLVYFAEFQFKSGTQRMSTFNVPYSWGGFTWLGVGTLGGVEKVTESENLQSSSVTFALNLAQPAWLAISIGAQDEYSDRPVKLYRCPLDAGFNLIDTPELCWTGRMDMMAVGIDTKGVGKIELKCETSSFGLKRTEPLRHNAAQHQATYPNDYGFNMLQQLIADPTIWISKKFQER